MSNSKSTSISLLFFLILQIHSSELKLFTKQWTANYTFSPRVVKSNGHLLVVGLQNNTVIVNSTFDGNQSNTCELDFLRPDEISGGKITVDTLGNGKIVINTVVMTESHKVFSKTPSPPLWRLLLILSPFDCSSLRRVELRRDQNTDFIALVPYHDSFDVFYYCRTKNSVDTLKIPQRYNDQGELMKLDYSVGLENQFLTKKIQSVEPYNASKGYISFIDVSKKNVLRLLNSRFETVTEVDFKSFFVYSWSSSYGRVNCLTFKVFGEGLVCEFLDDELKSKATVELQKLNDTNIYNGVLTNLPDGGALVTVAYRYDHLKTDGFLMKIHLHHIDVDGRKRKPVEIFERPIFYQDLMETILLDNGEVCFVNGGEMEPFKPFQRMMNSVWIDCVQVSDL